MSDDENDDNADIEQIKQLVNALENSEKTEEIVAWVKQISKPEAGVVDSLINVFMEQMEDITLANAILRTMRRMSEYAVEQVLPQMKENESFPKAIATYITNTDKQEMEGDGFVLLVSIFSSSSFGEVTSPEFIISLFNSLAFLKDDQIFKSVVWILIQIANEQAEEEEDENIVFTQCIENKNSRFFLEMFCNKYNYASEEERPRYNKFLLAIFEFLKEKEIDSFFYTNDLRALIDILIRELSNTENEELQKEYMQILAILLETNEYQKEKHRVKDILKVFGTMLNDDECDKDIKEQIEAIMALDLLDEEDEDEDENDDDDDSD